MELTLPERHDMVFALRPQDQYCQNVAYLLLLYCWVCRLGSLAVSRVNGTDCALDDCSMSSLHRCNRHRHEFRFHRFDFKPAESCSTYEVKKEGKKKFKEV